MAWTLNGSICDVKSCQLGLEGADRATVELRPGMAALPAAGEWVTLAVDGQPILYGQARPGRNVSGALDSQTVEIDGPWALLERVIYQQPQAVWEGGALANNLMPEVQLGVADDGTRRTTAQEVAAIVAYAIGAGLPITLDSSFTGRTIPAMQFSGISCGRAIMAMMEHHPDVAVYFDYSSGAAVLSCKPIAGLPVETIAGSSGGVTGAAFSPLLDYRPAGVRIIYTRTNFNGVVEVAEDTSGTIGTQGKAVDCINWTIPLEGAQPGPVEEQEIKTRPIPPAGASQTLLRNFFKKHLPWLTDAIADSITINNYTRVVTPPGVDEDATGEVPDEDYSTVPADYPRELVSGSLRPWMPFESAPMTVSAEFSYSGSGTLPESLRKVFGPTASLTRNFDVQVTGTDASTRVYRALAESLTLPAFPSDGLAAAYLAAFPSAAWSGSVTATAAAQPIYRPGIRLNVTGYDPAWGTMGALANGVSFDANGYAATVSVGPPAGLDFADFLSAQRVFQKRQIISDSSAAARRVQGLRAGGKTRGGTRAANRSSSSPDSGGNGAPDRAFQPQLRRAGANWNIGITPGVFQGQFGSVQPTLEPAGTLMAGAPVYWFPDALAGTTGTDSKKIWAKMILDDSQDYYGVLDGVQIHLRPAASDPDPTFVLGAEQWIHLATLFAEDGQFFVTSHIQGSPWVLRDGGPGSGYIATALG